MEQPFISCADFKFYSDFDSANFARVEHVQPAPDNVSSKVDVSASFEFNVWTRPDCAGTEFENGNRTWFYFGVKAPVSSSQVRLNVIDINKQAKMYSQGMAPVFKIVPGKPIWERIRDKPTYSTSTDNVFSLSFKYKTPDNPDAIIYFAFTYPYSYIDLQQSLRLIDEKYLHAPALSKDDIYYVRECVCKSVEGRRIDLLTISSYHNITTEREDRLQHLFPDKNMVRPFKFDKKKVIFVSARVHPGETPSTFVLNGFLNMLLSRDDAVALVLRRHYVFKLIPFLNPDGVSRGHYRTDTNGTNLNRVYLQPNMQQHPSVFAARALLRYHHHGGRQLPDTQLLDCSLAQDPNESLLNEQQQLSPTTAEAKMHMTDNASNAEIVVERDVSTLIETAIVTNDRRLSNMSLTEEEEEDEERAGCVLSQLTPSPHSVSQSSKEQQLTFCKRLQGPGEKDDGKLSTTADPIAMASLQQFVGSHRIGTRAANTALLTTTIASIVGGDGDGDSYYGATTADSAATAESSGLFLYIDMHGHASKKGIFMYGNHFDNMADSVECMLLPKIMSLNNHNFHFTACNFTERNMYLKDRRDGMSREGSGRVAVLKLTGLVRSYTLECNYNTGRLTNSLPPTVREHSSSSATAATASALYSSVPPKYSPQVFEEVGRALGASILDLTGQNPFTRLPNSDFHTLGGLRQWLMTNCRTSTPHHHHHIMQKQHQYQLNTDNCQSPATTTSPAVAVVDGAAVTATPLKQGVWRRTSNLAANGPSGRSSVMAVSRHHHHRHGFNQLQQQQQQRGTTVRYRHSAGIGTTSATIAKQSILTSGAVAAPSAASSVTTTTTTMMMMKRKKRRGGVCAGVVSATAAALGGGTRTNSMMAAAAAASSSKRQQMKMAVGAAATVNSRRLKLSEICWIKGGADTGQGKALIAKYTTGAAVATSAAPAVGNHQNSSTEDNLIVSWDSNNANPQVFAQRGTPLQSNFNNNTTNNSSGNARTIRPSVGTGTSAGGGQGATVAAAGSSNVSKRPPPTFRVHNFRRRHHCHHILRHHVTIATVAPPGTAIPTTTGSTAGKGQIANKLHLKQRKLRAATTEQLLPSATAATTAVPSTSYVTTEQLQQNLRLQRSKRKRKRNKSGLVTVHL